MINKQGLIFLTLTSLILVLSVYYVTMPTELLLTTNSLYTKDDDLVKEEVTVENLNAINTMKSVHNNERKEKVNELNTKLTSKELTFDEKNNIYNEIKVINQYESMEEDIEKIIKDEYKLNSFIKVDNDVIEVTIDSKIHDKKLVANIISSIEKKYRNMYISVNFKS